MRRTALKLAFAGAVMLAPLAAYAQDVPLTQVQRGKALVEQNCARCHAVGKTGDSPNPLSPTFREIVQRYDPDELQEALAEGIVTGHDNMPEFELKPPQINDLIAYLKSLEPPKTTDGQ